MFIDYPDKMIILDIPIEKLTEEILIIVKQYSEISNNFCCRIYDLSHAGWFQENNIKFYYGHIINNYYDMQGLINLGVEYIKITAPLTFDMEGLKKYSVKFRAVPNIAYDAYIPRENGILGQWIRPEDVVFYEKGIYVMEFEDIDLAKERTLFDIYAKDKCWRGNLNFLITNLNKHVNNLALSTALGEQRSHCKQKCMQNGKCHFCQTTFNFAKTVHEYKYKKEKMERENAQKEEN